jgi:hypothetical protein
MAAGLPSVLAERARKMIRICIKAGGARSMRAVEGRPIRRSKRKEWAWTDRYIGLSTLIRSLHDQNGAVAARSAGLLGCSPATWKQVKVEVKV